MGDVLLTTCMSKVFLRVRQPILARNPRLAHDPTQGLETHTFDRKPDCSRSNAEAIKLVNVPLYQLKNALEVSDPFVN
jgi:hypothetical protein